jgi:hypothetical protein
MNRVVVQYKVKPDQVEHNEMLIRAVYEELAAAQPAGFRYATVRLDDGVSFLHLAETEEAGPSPLSQLTAFREFVRDVADRCDEPPVSRSATLIGSYRLLDAP